MDNICRFCGNQANGEDFSRWVKPTFTDHDKLKPGKIICDDCLFWFEESSQELADRMNKDKPQRMRNYSHFIINGEWIPLSKGDKSRMSKLLTSNPFPELAAIAESGQKHIVFRATRNPVGSEAGWVQFEEQSLWVQPGELKILLEIIEELHATFSKTEIQSGNYLPYRVIEFGLQQWQTLEATIKPYRSSLFFNLVVFLAQRKDIENERNSSGPARDHLAGNRERVQKPVSAHDLGAVREYDPGQRLYQQPGEVRQLSLFEAGSGNTEQAHGQGGRDPE